MPVNNTPNASAVKNGSWLRQRDWLLIFSLSGCIAAYLLYWGFYPSLKNVNFLGEFINGVYNILNTMWLGLALGILAFGVIGRTPKTLISSALGQGGSFRGIVRAAVGGVLLDVCNHGVILIGFRLYQKGASAGQMAAFLIASPWNSLSLTIILISLVGFQLTLAFILGSLVIAIISGVLFDWLEKHQLIPANPQKSPPPGSFWKETRQALSQVHWTPQLLLHLIRDGVLGSSMIVRWLLLGVLIAAALRTFLTEAQFINWLGPSLMGLTITIIAATIIEVCSEGSVPIAADLANRAAAPGNAFAFMMAGVSTDATEILGIKETTKSWKISLALPLITLPQIILLSWWLNFS